MVTFYLELLFSTIHKVYLYIEVELLKITILYCILFLFIQYLKTTS